MKKIMFSDKFNLIAAVLAGTKTQTRRIIGKLQLKQFPKVSAAKAIENIIDKYGDETTYTTETAPSYCLKCLLKESNN